MSVRELERLDVWKKSKDFAVTVYREVLPLLPEEEKWGLNQQIRRSVQSIPGNIAEGYRRYYYQDNIRYCYIARGSLEETLSHLVLAYELNYLTQPIYDKLIHESEDLIRLLNGYIAYLKRSKRGQNEPGAEHPVQEDPTTYNHDSESDYLEPTDPDDSTTRFLYHPMTCSPLSTPYSL